MKKLQYNWNQNLNTFNHEVILEMAPTNFDKASRG